MVCRLTQYLLDNVASIAKPLHEGVHSHQVWRYGGDDVQNLDRTGSLLLARILCAQKYKPCSKFYMFVYGNTMHIKYRGMQARWFFERRTSLIEAVQVVRERTQ